MTATKPTESPAIESWFAQEPGAGLLRREQHYLQARMVTSNNSRALIMAPGRVLQGLNLEAMPGMVWQLEPEVAASDDLNASIRFVGDLMFSGLNWPFQPESLNLVVLSHSLPEPVMDSVLMEAWRVLAPEGRLIVTAIHDQSSPLHLKPKALRSALMVIPEQPLSKHHYCSKLAFSWRGNMPVIINQFWPLQILEWVKHKPGMIKKLQFKLPQGRTIIPAPVNMTNESVQNKVKAPY